jgi:hypothetical protein
MRVPIQQRRIQAYRPEKLLYPIIIITLVGNHMVDPKGLAYNTARTLSRVQAAIRVLEDQGNFTPQVPDLSFRCGRDILAFKEELAAGRLIKPDHTPSHSSLPTAALSDQTQGFSFLYFKGDPVYRFDIGYFSSEYTPGNREIHFQVFDIQDSITTYYRTHLVFSSVFT